MSLPPLQEMCWCGLPAGTRMPGVLAHCCVDHRAILKAHPRRRLWTGMGGTDGYGVEMDTPIFTMHPHDENPICNCGAEDAEEETPCAETCPYGWPNFKHKPSGFAVHWHKWIGRSMEIVGAPPADLAAMIDECIASIPKGATP